MRILLEISIFFVLLLSACTGPDSRALKDADAIMEQHPDSALAILQTIDRNHISDRDLHYYALLMTQTQVKTDVPLASDSLISIAYGKYAGSWRGDKGIRSSFYMGEVFFNQEKPREAMRHYLTAYEDSKRLGNDYWHAKSAERIADLFFNAYNYPEAARYRKEAIEYFGNAERVTNQRYAIADLATDFMNDSRFDEALGLLDSVMNICTHDNMQDSLLIDYISEAKDNALVYLGRTDETLGCRLSSLGQMPSNADLIDQKILQLRFPDLKKDSVSEVDIIRSLRDLAKTDEDKVLSYYAMYQSTKTNTRKSMDVNMVDSLIFYQNAVAQKIIRESITSAERDFFLSSSERDRQKMTQVIVVAVLAVLGAFCVLAAIWRIHSLREKARKADLDANVEAFVAMKAKAEKLEADLYSEILGKEQQSDKYRKDIDELKEKHAVVLKEHKTVLNSLFKEKWSMLSMLCEEYYITGLSQKTREIIQNKIESEVKSIGTPEGFRLIEETTDRYMDNIASKLRTECPDLKEKDIQFCILIFSGFSVRAISFILDTNPNNIYAKKRRLKIHISKSESLFKDLFINALG